MRITPLKTERVEGWEISLKSLSQFTHPISFDLFTLYSFVFPPSLTSARSESEATEAEDATLGTRCSYLGSLSLSRGGMVVVKLVGGG